MNMLEKKVRPKRLTATAIGFESNAPMVRFPARRALVAWGLPESGGTPLEPGIRVRMEDRFGQDFSRVLVHTGTEAARSAQQAAAQAYTVGRDVVFGAGQYAPKTAEGQTLLAHELAHIVQQGRGHGSAASAALEAEGTHAATAVASGRMARVSLGAAPGIQRQSLSVHEQASVTREEAQLALNTWLDQTRQLQNNLQGDGIRRSLRMTPEVRAAVLQMFRDDPNVGHQISIQSWLDGKTFPSETAEFARQVARYLPPQVPAANIAHLRRVPTDDRSTARRVGDVVERSQVGEPGPDSPTARATPPHQPTTTERTDQFMQDQARRARQEQGVPEPTQIGPVAVDVLRFGRIISGLPGAINPPHRATPPLQARDVPEVEAAIGQIVSNSLTPAALRGTPQADGFPDAQAVARELAGRLDAAQRQGRDSISIDLGAYANQQDDIMQGFPGVLRIVVTALPHHASAVRTVVVTLGGRQRWVPVPRVEPRAP